jgi:beta-phosphoglucomutase
VNNLAAMLFDMDGVIVDSTAVHTEAWRQYLRNQGLGAADIGPRMLGKHNGDIVRDFFGADLNDEAVAAHGRAKERIYRALMAPELSQRLVPGVREFLHRYDRLPKAVASNAEPENVAFVLRGAGFEDCFRIVIDGHEVEKPKPDPEIYLTAAARLQVRPEACVVFEDSHTGVAAAKAAGMKVVGLTTTVSEFPDVDLTIRNFEDPELETWLRDQFSA